jgi:hypothetical protein
MAATIFRSYSGTPTGVGPIESLAPSPGPSPGRIVGLSPALHLLGDIGAPLLGAAATAREKVRDFNDDEVPAIGGAVQGKMLGPGRSQPPRGGPSAPGGPWGGGGVRPPRGPKGAPPAGSEQDLEDIETAKRAKQAGQENRDYVRRIVGTPKRRPRNEDPFGPGDYGTAQTTTSRKNPDLRRWTP